MPGNDDLQHRFARFLFRALAPVSALQWRASIVLDRILRRTEASHGKRLDKDCCHSD